MKMLKAKSGKFGFSTMNAGKLIEGIILIVLGLKVFAVGLPEMATAGNEVSDTGYSLTSLFASDSVLILAIVGAVLLAVVLQVLPGKGR